MRLLVNVQKALDEDASITIPDDEQITQWADRAVVIAGNMKEESTQMTVRIVDEEEITQLNSDYRQKDNVTNVLSFPFIQPPGIPMEESVHLLGDLVICAPVVNREAEEQHKPMLARWAHMVVHGTLHLLGYDHQDDREAKVMEDMETMVLAEFGFENPYE